jgi:hypothetical protein
MKVKPLIPIILAYVLGTANVTSALEHDPMNDYIGKLRVNDQETRDAAQAAILAAREKTIDALLGFLQERGREGMDTDSVRRAIYLLGEIRATKASYHLVDIIAFPFMNAKAENPEPGPSVGMGILGKKAEEVLPAVEALIKIGQPCLPDILQKIGSTTNIIEVKACLRVLIVLNGTAHAKEMLEAELHSNKNAQFHECILTAIRILTEMPR